MYQWKGSIFVESVLDFRTDATRKRFTVSLFVTSGVQTTSIRNLQLKAITFKRWESWKRNHQRYRTRDSKKKNFFHGGKFTIPRGSRNTYEGLHLPDRLIAECAHGPFDPTLYTVLGCPTAPPVDPFKSYPLMVQPQPLCKKVSIRHTHPWDTGPLGWPSIRIAKLPLGIPPIFHRFLFIDPPFLFYLLMEFEE